MTSNHGGLRGKTSQHVKRISFQIWDTCFFLRLLMEFQTCRKETLDHWGYTCLHLVSKWLFDIIEYKHYNQYIYICVNLKIYKQNLSRVDTCRSPVPTTLLFSVAEAEPPNSSPTGSSNIFKNITVHTITQQSEEGHFAEITLLKLSKLLCRVNLRRNWPKCMNQKTGCGPGAVTTFEYKSSPAEVLFKDRGHCLVFGYLWQMACRWSKVKHESGIGVWLPMCFTHQHQQTTANPWMETFLYPTHLHLRDWRGYHFPKKAVSAAKKLRHTYSWPVSLTWIWHLCQIPSQFPVELRIAS